MTDDGGRQTVRQQSSEEQEEEKRGRQNFPHVVRWVKYLFQKVHFVEYLSICSSWRKNNSPTLLSEAKTFKDCFFAATKK